MSARQRERLTDLYEDFASRRVEQEGKIAKWHNDLQKAQSPTSFDERKAAGLLKSINEAGQKITDAFLRARGEALETLSPNQRAALRELTTRDANGAESPVSPVQPARDEYYQLLLMPVAELLGTPVDTQAARRLAAQRNDRDAAARYGDPYYGYGYGRGGSLGIFGGFGNGGGFGFGFGFGGGHRHQRRHR